MQRGNIYQPVKNEDEKSEKKNTVSSNEVQMIVLGVNDEKEQREDNYNQNDDSSIELEEQKLKYNRAKLTVDRVLFFQFRGFFIIILVVLFIFGLSFLLLWTTNKQNENNSCETMSSQRSLLTIWLCIWYVLYLIAINTYVFGICDPSGSYCFETSINDYNQELIVQELNGERHYNQVTCEFPISNWFAKWLLRICLYIWQTAGWFIVFSNTDEDNSDACMDQFKNWIVLFLIFNLLHDIVELRFTRFYLLIHYSIIHFKGSVLRIFGWIHQFGFLCCNLCIRDTYKFQPLSTEQVLASQMYSLGCVLCDKKFNPEIEKNRVYSFSCCNCLSHVECCENWNTIATNVGCPHCSLTV